MDGSFPETPQERKKNCGTSSSLLRTSAVQKLEDPSNSLGVLGRRAESCLGGAKMLHKNLVQENFVVVKNK